MTRMIPAAALALALAAAVPFVPAMASSDSDRRASTEMLSRATVDAAGAATAARAAGYGPVRSVEWEHTAWEVKAVDAQGRRVELRVDAATGAVTRRDR